MTCGIYVIRVIDGDPRDCYVGQSTNIEKRWDGHTGSLVRQSHGNRLLQEAWNKHGGQNLSFQIVKVIEGERVKERLFRAEQQMINELNPRFNIAPALKQEEDDKRWIIKLTEKTLLPNDRWKSEFKPVIRSDDRSPQWFTVRYSWAAQGVFFRVLRHVGQRYFDFTFEQFPTNKKIKEPIVRSWFPGYAFLEIDIERDFWQQIYQMPGFTEILGNPSPLPEGELKRIEGILVKRVGKVDPGRKFNPGEEVKMKAGPLTSHTGIIKSLSTNGKMATIVAMIFGRPTNVDVSITDIEKI